MTASLNKRWGRRSSNGQNDGVSFLVHVYPPMPTVPDLGRSKHATATTHVPESSLTGTVGTTTGDTGDTGHGTTGTPGLGRGLVSGLLRHGIGLALVVGDLGVDEVDDVETNGGFHDIGQSDSVDGLVAMSPSRDWTVTRGRTAAIATTFAEGVRRGRAGTLYAWES